MFTAVKYLHSQSGPKCLLIDFQYLVPLRSFFFSSVRQMKPILVNSLVRVNRHKVSLLTQRESSRAVVSVSFPASGREGDGGPRAPRDSHQV